MTRKYIQMGMTRAKRYANYKGGRKYDKTSGTQNEKSKGHAGQREKLEASEIFRKVWQRCRAHAGYQDKKVAFLREQKGWDRDGERGFVKDEEEIKLEGSDGGCDASGMVGKVKEEDD